MKYVSTRGEAPVLEFEDVLLTGLARDGGLYVPAEYPVLTDGEIAAFSGAPYRDVALAVMRPFIGDAVGEAELRAMIGDAYAGFRHPSVTPLVQSGDNEWLLELHRGPTLAFKDIAMQLLARLMDHALERRRERATVICATSGDTGGAAVEAFAGRERADLFVLLPRGRVSEVQRRMMTTSDAANIHALEIDGTFDDCQALVKALFNDAGFRRDMALTGVNSINWARVMAQAVYYFVAALALGGPARAVSFTVPTGNFGDILAGYVASRMGLPVDRLVIATNVNDILARTVATGRHELGQVTATASPSMDIQISSNFERLLFDLVGRDPATVRRHMGQLAQSGGFTLSEAAVDALRRDFDAGRADGDETAAAIRDVHRESGIIIDPHTAVATAVARRMHHAATPMVVLATADGAKFPDTVEAACGMRPALPPTLADLCDRRERVVELANDLDAVRCCVAERARVASGTPA